MAKYDKLRKPDRDKAVIRYAKKHPNLSQEEVGRIFNVCQQRVSQILNKGRRDGKAEGSHATPGKKGALPISQS